MWASWRNNGRNKKQCCSLVARKGYRSAVGIASANQWRCSLTFDVHAYWTEVNIKRSSIKVCVSCYRAVADGKDSTSENWFWGSYFHQALWRLHEAEKELEEEQRTGQKEPGGIHRSATASFWYCYKWCTDNDENRRRQPISHQAAQ